MPRRLLLLILGALVLAQAFLLLRGAPAAVGQRPAPSATAARLAAPSPTPPPAATSAATSIAETSAAGRTFTETFDGAPASPQPWRPTSWDITVHSRDRDTWGRLEPMQALHSHDCAAPPETHEVSSYEGAVFVCRDHLMTAISAGGYGMIYLTPNQLVDFSAGEATVSFDLSTERTSLRDWVDLWITPYEDNLQLALDKEAVDGNGEPRRGIHVRMVEVNGKTVFRAYRIEGHKATEIGGGTGAVGYEEVLTPSQKQRETFVLQITKGHLRFGMPAHNLWWVDAPMPELDWGQGVVQFGHHSYNPGKGCDECGPNTWHWDNISISPAQPFTIIRAGRRTVDAETSPALPLAAPAPAGAHLRFAAIGKKIEVSFDGGASWERAQLAGLERQAEEHFSSYWTPIPAGTTSVRFRGEKWWGGGWHVRDVTVWARP